ncbi:MAG: DUF362 domain-containing protein [Candidatus Zixiibacteriota bacterium]|nr:MAG: DUF362 domain-containing protein [candidate division Zixibacteria bacterium]
MSRVIVVRWAGGKADFGLDKATYGIMLEAALRALRQTADLDSVIGDMFPRGAIGIKTNCLTRKLNSTPVALADGLAEILTERGVDENNIVVWDRSNRELSEAGFLLNASFTGRRCLGTDTSGVGYSSRFFESGGVNSLVSEILTRTVEHSINLPVLKDHSLAGMSAGMKNMYGAIHNPNKYHGNNCSPYCAHVSNLAPIRSKHRMTILDAVRVQFNGGPGYMAQYIETYAGIIVSADPIACDRVGLEILEHMRKKYGLPTLENDGRPVKYLQPATELGLGESDLSKIELKVLSADQTGSVRDGELY